MKNTFFRKFFGRPYRECTHSHMIQQLLRQNPPSCSKPVFIEIGAGITTFTLAEIAKTYNAHFYSCDINMEKVRDIKERIKTTFNNVTFLTGDSLQSLKDIIHKHSVIHFVFFDSAPSSRHTFKEFITVEKSMKNGSCILIDNAALPGEKALLTLCRKGKILVPYLLASPAWKVTGHPHAGDSMVSAVKMKTPDYADPDYERPGWTDYWEYLNEGTEPRQRKYETGKSDEDLFL